MTIKQTILASAIGLVAALPGRAEAQRQVALELHGGFNVPTFDIADVADAGPSVGGGIAVQLSDRLWVLGEADFGFHSGADLPGGASGPDVNVYHFMGKLAYQVYSSADGRLSLLLNLGAGAMMFDVDGAAGSNTYPAINAGAKLIYALGTNLDLVLSPQGDIAFTDEAETGGSTAWVWPVSAGFRVRL